MATPTTDTGAAPRASGLGIGAIAFAVVAAILAVYALGVSLSTRNGTGVAVSAAAPAAADGEVGGSEVSVALSEFSISQADLTLAPTDSLVVQNTGAAEHNYKIKETAVGTSNIAPGESAALDISSLAPGTYQVYCDIAGHETAGMSGTLTIAADGSSTMEGMDMSGSEDVSGSADPSAMQAAMEQAMQDSIGSFPAETSGKGAQPLEPTILDDGTKLFELTVDEVDWEVEPGKIVKAVGYNGAIPGPTMNVDVGDRVTVRIINELDHEGTSWHPHGLKNHDFKIDGVTYISQDPVATGDAMDYTFVAQEESVVGYHSHHMSLHQVPDGLFGMMIVGDYAALSGIDGIVDEQTMIVNDSGAIGFSLNGKSFPATAPYQYTQGDKVIVHYANEGQMAHPMHLHNQTGTVIAKDGYLLQPSARYQGDTFNIAPGERLTVVYAMDNVGTWVWHCHILSHVKRSDGSMFGMLDRGHHRTARAGVIVR